MYNVLVSMYKDVSIFKDRQWRVMTRFWHCETTPSQCMNLGNTRIKFLSKTDLGNVLIKGTKTIIGLFSSLRPEYAKNGH